LACSNAAASGGLRTTLSSPIARQQNAGDERGRRERLSEARVPHRLVRGALRTLIYVNSG